MMLTLLMLGAALAQAQPVAGDPPKSWIDPGTGHRVVRLTSEPGSASLYFNQNGYTAGGKKLVYTTPDGISVLDLATQQTRQVVAGRVRLIDAGRRTQRIYYTRDGAAFSTGVESGTTRRIAALPPRGSIATVNADETLLAGTYIEGEGQDYNSNRPAAQQSHALDQPRNKGEMMEQRWAARLPMALFTINTASGSVKTIHRANDWLNHLLFSPAVFPGRSGAADVLPRGPLAQSGPHLDHPHRWHAAHQDPHAHDGDGDLRPRVLERGRQDHLV